MNVNEELIGHVNAIRGWEENVEAKWPFSGIFLKITIFNIS